MLRFINFVFLTLLLLAHAGTDLPPSVVWWPSFLGLAYPFLLLANVLFVAFWISIRKAAFLISLPILLLNAGRIGQHVQWHKQADTKAGTKLMSYNVRMFDLYNWTGYKHTWSKSINYIIREKPKILLFQEYYSRNSHKSAPSKRFAQELDMKHSRIQRSSKQANDLGLATFSHFPIINHQFLKSQNHIFALLTDIVIQHDTIRFINVHLQSVGFNHKAYNFIDSLNISNIQHAKQGVFSIGRKLRRAFTKRSLQTTMLTQAICASPHRVILGGDFNDTPSSYTYFQLRRSLLDSFVESGSGMGISYNRLYMPLRIDYLLTDKRIKTNNFRTHQVDFSDHRPISCYFSTTATAAYGGFVSSNSPCR